MAFLVNFSVTSEVVNLLLTTVTSVNEINCEEQVWEFWNCYT